jgi:cardiolipin synthase A/B
MIELVLAIGIPLFHLMGLFSAFHAVMNARTSQGSIAWTVSLLLMPYIAVPAYWVLGRSRFHGYVTARRSGDVTIQEKLGQVMDQVAPYGVPSEEIGSAGDAAQRLADLPYLTGNAVDLLIDGDATFDSILAGIDAATSYILFQFFIVKDDEIGREVQKRLIAKAAAGVKIYFLYDEIGSHDLPEPYLDELRKAGIEVYAFHTRKGRRNRFQINFRNHRKVVVVDGKVAWIGGHNVGDEYLGRDPKFGHWRDTHIRIEGPATISVQISFAEDWNWAAGTPIPELVWTPVPSATGNLPVLVVPSGPADKLETATLMFLHAINMAKKRIWIASPYFVPDDAIISALQLAGLRGVDVRILIPDTADHLLVYLAAFTYFDEASQTGVRFFRYTDGFLHQKVMLVDHNIASVGTANFDNRSFRLNFEITGIVADEAFASQVEQMLETDLAHSREMTQEDVDGHSFGFKLGTRFARLTSPIQ